MAENNQPLSSTERIKMASDSLRGTFVESLANEITGSINEDDYWQMLKKVIEKKDALLTEKVPYKRKYKLHQYALSRGYESDLISDVLKGDDLWQGVLMCLILNFCILYLSLC